MTAATRYVCQRRVTPGAVAFRRRELRMNNRAIWLIFASALLVLVVFSIIGCQQQAKQKITPASSEARRVDSSITTTLRAPKPTPPAESKPELKVRIYVITPATACPMPAQPDASADRRTVDGGGAEAGPAVPGSQP